MTERKTPFLDSIKQEPSQNFKIIKFKAHKGQIMALKLINL